jgi:hypothetical protein
MNLCDLCGQSRKCLPRQIEGKDYDICPDCWNPLAKKLKGKGRAIKGTEMISLPRQITIPEPKEPRQLPGQPPKIWGGAGKAH